MRMSLGLVVLVMINAASLVLWKISVVTCCLLFVWLICRWVHLVIVWVIIWLLVWRICLLGVCVGCWFMIVGLGCLLGVGLVGWFGFRFCVSGCLVGGLL